MIESSPERTSGPRPEPQAVPSIASSCPTVMAALMSPISKGFTTTAIPVTPGVKDRDGFLTPPPASTLLIRRTRTNSTGSSTYVIASSTASSPSPRPSTSRVAVSSNNSAFQPDYKSLKGPHLKKLSRNQDGHFVPGGRPYKKPKIDGKLSTILSAPSNHNHHHHSHSHHKRTSLSDLFGQHSAYRTPISPLAFDPHQSLSVLITPQRSVSTFSPSPVTPPPPPPLALETEVPCSSAGSSQPAEWRGTKPQISRGKPAYITEIRSLGGGGGKDFKAAATKVRSEGKDGVRKFRRRKRFSMDKKGSRQRTRHVSDSSVAYDMEQAGDWRPTDDLRLIINLLQTNDLSLVYQGVKFSCVYSLENLEARWAGILYNPAISKVTQSAIQKLHPKVVRSIFDKALFSHDEHALLRTIRSSQGQDSKIVQTKLEKLLRENAMTFLKWRTAKSLFEEWQILKECHMLCDQDLRRRFEKESFADFEESVNDRIVSKIRVDPNVRKELLLENMHVRKRIRILEEEVARWQLVADMVTEIDPSPFEEGSYAMLRGKQVRYLMRSREITLGRRTELNKTESIDADLTLEGSTYKVSRKQATIQLRSLGDFAIKNHGKHGFYVDGKQIMPGSIGRLSDQSVIEISRLRFIFLVNHKMVQEYVAKQVRLEVKREMSDLQKLARAIKAASNASASSSASSVVNSQILTLASQNICAGTTAIRFESVPHYNSVPPPLVPSTSSPLTMALTRPMVRPYIQAPPPYPGQAVRFTNPNSNSAPDPIFRKPFPPPPPPSYSTSISVSGGLGHKSIQSPIQFGDLTIRPGLPPHLTMSGFK